MVLHPLRCGGYLLVVLTGWAVGRWAWPAGVDGLSMAGGSQGQAQGRAAAAVSEAGSTTAALGKKPATPAVDGKAVGLELRAAGSEGEFRSRAREMALEPPPALMDFLAAVTDSETVRRVLLEDAVVWACSRKPELGLALLSSLADRGEIASLTMKALHFFPPKDLPLVKACYEKQPRGAFKTALLRELLPVLQRANRREAIRLASAFHMEPQPDGLSREDLPSAVFSRGMAQPLTAAEQEALLQEFPAELRPFMENVAIKQKFRALRNHDKSAAFDMIGKLPEAELQIPGAAAELFTQWAETDPLRAAQHLSQLPEAAATPDLYLQFAAKWTEGNVGQASQWVRGLADSPLKQAAITGLAGKLGKDYPVEAITWAGSLTDPAMRQSTLNSILAGADRAAAPPGVLRQAVEALNLTAEEQAGLHFIPATP